MAAKRKALGFFALGSLAAIGWGLGKAAGRRAGALPEPVLAVMRRHAPADDVDSFTEAVATHVQKGRKLTPAAARMLAAVHFDPDAAAAIARELKALGWSL